MLAKLKSFVTNFTHSFMLYPLTSIIGLISAVLFVNYIGMEHNGLNNEWLLKICFLSFLSLPMFFAIEVISYEKREQKYLKLILSLLSITLLISYYYQWNFVDARYGIQLILYSIVFHLIVAISLVNRIKNSKVFWQFNQILFTNFFISALFTGLLVAGVTVALFSIKELFNVSSLNETIIFQIVVFIAITFNTQFFLNSISENNKIINENSFDQAYPKIVKKVVIFVFIPLCLVYLAILYAYAGKILIEMKLPRGMVSSLIFAYSIMGILSFLFVNPLREENKYKWIKFFSKYYFILLQPLFILLFIALFTRINAYGFTPFRYFGLVTSFWLVAISWYYIFSKKKLIQLIPSTLLVVTFLISIGPMSFYSVTQRSQMARISEKFSKYKVKEMNLKGDTILLSGDVYYALSSDLRTLVDFGNKDDIKHFFANYINKNLEKCLVKYETTQTLDSLNIVLNNDEYKIEELVSISNQICECKGYSKFISISSDYDFDSIDSIENGKLKIKDMPEENKVEITFNNSKYSLSYDFLKNQIIAKEQRYLTIRMNKQNYQIYFSNISFEKYRKTKKWTLMDFEIFFMYNDKN